MVYKQYLKYNWHAVPPQFEEAFRTFLLLHDVGKPKAFQAGDKKQQHKYTQEIIKQVWNKTKLSEKELSLVLALSGGTLWVNIFKGCLALRKLRSGYRLLQGIRPSNTVLSLFTAIASLRSKG